MNKLSELSTIYVQSFDLDMLAIFSITDNYFVHFSPAIKRILGYAQDELLHVTHEDLPIHPDDIEHTLHELDIIKECKVSYGFVNRYITKGGVVKHLEWNAKLIDGMIYSAARDITEVVEFKEQLEAKVIELNTEIIERKRVEKRLRSANTMLKGFAHAASHDLREPLRTITNYMHLIRDEFVNVNVISDELELYFDFVFNASVSVEHLIKSLLTYAYAQNVAPKLEMISPVKVIAIVLGSLDVQIQEENAELIDNTDGIPPVFLFDVNHLVILIQNLLSNAIKFHKPGIPPKIIYEFKEMIDSILFIVEDNGIGISEEYIEMIFNPFYRLHPQSIYPGSGIGLATIRTLIDFYGGYITVSSDGSSGSVFEVSIPKNISLL